MQNSHEGHHLADCCAKLEALGMKEAYVSTFYEYNFGEDNGTKVALYAKPDTDRLYQINITSSVGETYIEEATDKELDEIAEDFKIGMTEDELWEVYEKYDLYPCHIEEKHDDEAGITRYYYAKFYIGSYNSGDYSNYKIHTDFFDGKISDIRIYND